MVIVGGGIVGLTTALALARAGLAVTVVERGAIGVESTWAGAGILSALPPWGYPEEVTALIDHSRALWPALAAEIEEATGIDPEYRTRGMLVLDSTGRDAAVDWCEGHGWRHGVEPGAAWGLPGGEALRLPQVAQVRNPRLAKGMAELLRLRGVTLLPQQGRVGPVVEGDRVTGVWAGGSFLPCSHLVVCAGAWSAEVLGDLAAGVAIHPVRGQMLLFRDRPGRLPVVVYRQGRYLVPRDDGHILAGSTLERVGFDKSTTPAARNELLMFARATLPWLKEDNLVGHWAGLRPGSPGNLPIVSRHARVVNLFLNAGHFRYGVTMAPGSAGLLADLLLERRPRLPPGPYAWPAA